MRGLEEEREGKRGGEREGKIGVSERRERKRGVLKTLGKLFYY
ncbi:hypothetical protein BVRB_4g096890 [Beta vulgaris subsp. vulgaris]|uniref:Uncharacterized protein n=1 Tax=Beta vulgaris subsp. vulgaris TaxID=3555 RepID=A0A0J8E4C2_BETVV|nr:hypothetical protein BVRB_4g096890 [Beta vulgaris subsp. vulgaris]